MLVMKVILILFLNFVNFVVQCEEIVLGIPVNKKQFQHSLARIGDFDAVCDTTFGPKCQNCYTLMNCLGKDPPASTSSCADKDPNRPYCEGNICSATTSDSTCKPQSNFLCSGEGYFPDPNNCNRYYICSEVGEGNAVAYECPTNYIYKSIERGCVRKRRASDCVTVDCLKTPNDFGVYAKDPAFFYYCQKDKTGPRTVMMKCEDEYNMQYNPTLGYCSFHCSKEGYFPNVLDCKKYYYCYKVKTAFQVDSMNCPMGFYFNPRTKVCLRATFFTSTGEADCDQICPKSCL